MARRAEKVVTVAAVLALCTTKGDGKSFDQVVVASISAACTWNFRGVMSMRKSLILMGSRYLRG